MSTDALLPSLVREELFTWTKCMVCQLKKKHEQLVKKPGNTKELYERVKKLSGYGEPKYVVSYARFKLYTANDAIKNKATYHRTCYQNAMHPTLLIKWTKDTTTKEPSQKAGTIRRLTRSQVEVFNKEICFFCQSDNTDHLFNMSTFSIDA